jgi:hypothetical protein
MESSDHWHPGAAYLYVLHLDHPALAWEYLRRTITALAVDGLYRTDHHLAITKAQAAPGRDPRELVDAHIRRLGGSKPCAGRALRSV